MTDARPMKAPSDDPAAVARLRHDVDLGRTRDKVAFPDPAAAPLGTDDEAAGTPATTAELHMENEALPPPPSRPPDSRRAILVGASIAAAAAVVIVAVAALV
ncbi:hypothetical protein [Chelatococcus composti]|uniref:Uncharacterized protein n=1 Tax=Chelatococcus composti TaxID=1743235 RepID=A0A841K2T9_9HYPH|nr:hypothetical protein [Chelatococcus composti]MBB6166811.1 hypothetical protein [Chelatococcus composti]MBS7734263.1 hypothetical protein [Chelatococcus composti]GGG25596.1 hypothetical protein GCM10008026_02210 [Chelatococcus composti]